MGVLVGWVENFKYLGRTLDQTDYDLLVVRRNVKQERRLWGRLGEMIIRVGVNPKVVVISYRSVTHEVILFDLESWVLLTAM